MRPALATEAEAWDYLASLWAEAKPFANDGPFWVYDPAVFVSGHGLCSCMHSEYLKSFASAMLGRLEHKAPKLRQDLFRWPLTQKGALARKRFCKRMAALCRKEQDSKQNLAC